MWVSRCVRYICVVLAVAAHATDSALDQESTVASGYMNLRTGQMLAQTFRPLTAELAQLVSGAQVCFYRNDILLGDDDEPYEVIWTDPLPGQFDLRATFEDVLGITTTSAPVALTVIAPGPANDDFANRATLLGSFVLAQGSTLGATLETGEPRPWPESDGRTIWWRWVAPVSAWVYVSASGPADETVGVAAYFGQIVDGLTLVEQGPSSLYFQATGGREYEFVVDSVNGPVENVILRVAASDVGFGNFSSVATAPATLALAVQGTFTNRAVDRVVYYSGNDPLGELATPPYALNHTFDTPGNYDLWVEVADTEGVRTRSDVRTLTIRPSNDNLANAIVLNGYSPTATGSTVAATYEPIDMVWGENQGGHSIWYTWTAPGSGTCWVFGTGPGSGLLLNAFAVANSGSRQLVSFNAYSQANTPLVFQVLEGVTYQISVDGFYHEEGPIEVTILLTPPNDNIANASIVREAQSSIHSDNRGATREPGEPQHGGTADGRSVWWRWEPPGAAPATVTVTSVDLNPAIVAIYTSDSLGNLVLVASATSSDGSMVQVNFDATEGTSYFVVVDGTHPLGTDFALELALNLLRITAPRSGSTLKAPVNIPIEISLPRDPPAFTKFQLTINERVVATSPDPVFLWSDAPAGSHRLVARGLYGDNQTNVSPAIVVLVYTNDVMPAPQIAAGFVSSYAITAAGQLYFWGPASPGDFNLNRPVAVYLRYPELARYPDGVTEWIKVSGDSWAMGNNGAVYRVGTFPIPLPEDATKWLWLDAGTTIADNGKYYVNGVAGYPQATNHWVMIRAGYHLDDQRALWERAATNFLRIPFPPGVTAWRDFSPRAHLLALSSDGQLYSAGYNYSGQLGRGDSGEGLQLVAPPEGSSGWIAIAAGGNHSLAITDTGRLYSWGRNWEYQLGLGNGAPQTVNRPTLVNFPPGVTAWTAVAAGYTHSLALGNDCQLYGWGANDQGQLGLGTLPPQVVPHVIAGLGSLCGNTLLQADAESTRLSEGTYAIGFSSILNRTYTIQYSSDAMRWTDAYPPLVGTGGFLQWIDDGPPKTASSPSAEAVRFYRVLHSN